MATREEAVRFSLIDNVTKGLIKIQDSVTGVGAALVKLNAGAQLAATGIQALSTAGAAFNGLIKGASDAQFQLAGLQAAIGATPEELAKLDAEAKRVSETLGLFSKTEVLDALGGLARAGLDAEQSLKALNPVIALAASGQVDLQFATDQTVNTLTQFGLGIEKASQVANGLKTAADASTTDVRSLGLALSYAATQAAGAGQTLEQTLEILAGLAQAGIQGERAGTALQATFTALRNESGPFRKALQENYGLATTDLIAVIEGLRKSADGGKAALSTLGAESSAIEGLVRLPISTFNSLRDSITGAGTAAEDATAKLADTFQAASGRLVNILTNLRNELAAPILTPLADALESLAKRVSEFAKTEDFELLKQAIANFATEAGLQLEDLIAKFDFKEAAERAREQFDSLKESLANIVASISAIASAINITAATISTAFNAAVTAVADFSARLVDLGIFLSENIPGYNLLFGDLTDKAYLLRDSLRDVAKVRFEETGKSAAGLAKAIDLVDESARPAAASVRGVGGAVASAGAAAESGAAGFGKLADEIKNIATQADLDSAIDKFNEFADKAGASAEETQRLAGELNRAQKEFGSTGDEVQKVTLYVEQADGSFKTLGDSAGDTGKQATESFGAIRTEAESAVEVTERLIRAFEGANDAAAVSGAVDQFERMRQAGVLTEQQIKAIEAAAKKAQAKFAEAGKEGEDAFRKVADAADDATDAVESVAGSAEDSAKTLNIVFAQLAQAQEESIQRNDEITKQIEDQREQANSLLEKEIELIERKLNLSREELAIAERLRNQYKLADQDRIDRYAQLIARQRELNREREEELRIISTSGGSAAPGGGSSGVNGRPVGTGRPAAGVAGDSSGDGAQSAPLTVRTLARLLEPELARLRLRGG